MNLDVRWAQVDFALAADGPGRAAHACGAFTHVAPAVDALVADDCAIGAWFLRKPPDVRLRLGVTGRDDEGARNRLGAAIEAATVDGHVTGWAWSRYEPETARFGGPGAVAVAHRHFCRDTWAWHRTDRRLRAHAVAMPPAPATRAGSHGPAVAELLGATVLARSAALVATLADTGGLRPDRVWDHLRELAAPISPEDGPRTDPEPDTGPDTGRDADTGGPASEPSHPPRPDEQAWIEADRVAHEIPDLPTAVSERWAALVIQFDCNRWGVGGAGQRALARLAPDADRRFRRNEAPA